MKIHWRIPIGAVIALQILHGIYIYATTDWDREISQLMLGHDYEGVLAATMARNEDSVFSGISYAFSHDWILTVIGAALSYFIYNKIAFPFAVRLPVQAAPLDKYEEIGKLAQLKATGAITDEEFSQAKDRILKAS